MKLRLARKILSRNNSNKANYWNGYTHSSIESFIFFSKNERVRKALRTACKFSTPPAPLSRPSQQQISAIYDDSAVSVPCYHCNRYRLYRCKRYQDFSSAFQFAKVIYFFNFWRIESPFNSILLAFATKRSIMASAKVGSPM